MLRDPAQPLLTLLEGSARVELSGATAANWAAKTANLLVDGLGGPERVGLLLPLHWQVVTLLQGIRATGAACVVAREPQELAGCAAAFVTAEAAEAALDAGVADVLAVSTAPMGGRLTDLPPMVLDAGTELPSYGDHFAARPGGRVLQGGHEVLAPDLGLGMSDRVLTTLAPADGLAAGLLGPLAAGSALVLCPAGVPDAVREEAVTASVGVDVPGARRLA